MKVLGFVQTLERRRHLAERLSRQLAESDLDGHEVLYQLPEHDAWDHFLRVFDAMASSDADLVIRFEDDAIASRHLKHNVVNWPVIYQPDFGSGWLYSPPSSVLDYIYHRRLNNPSKKFHLEGSVAVVFRRADLAWIIPACKGWIQRFPGGYAYDFCISAVMREQKRKLWLHDPPIVEHDHTAMSTFGHNITPECRSGLFKPHFKRISLHR